jgi:methylated-DNA-protein-cysteine methyltransferase-like protein
MKQIREDNKDIYEAIYEIVRLIPRGRVTSFGAIAAALGMRSGARMVGFAMNHAHGQHPKVPAHRVVNSAGLLSGKFHFTPPERMQQLLEQEKVRVVNDKVQDFSNVFWDPAKELAELK